MRAVLVFRHMRWMLPLGVLAGLAACLAGGTTGKAPQSPPPLAPISESSDVKIDLPAIPSKIDVTTSAPTDGTAPDKRSPILDILKA